MDYKEIERKWQKAWEDAKAFEVEPNDRESFLVTAAFPYVNSPQHIGHIRTYGTADTYARYKRMKGFNVLYPMAFHATGTPLLAFAKRILSNDQELIDELKIFHVPDHEIKKMTDPKYIADYFVKEMENGMRLAGYGIDWRRKFISTEPLFSRLVEWQFQKLKEGNYLTKGKHPVGWCTNDKSAVGQHDTKHDVQPEIQQITVVKFKDSSSDVYFTCATYRPETLYGVTNIFVNDKIAYVIVKVGNEKYYISKEAATALEYQLDLKVESEISGSELLSKKAINPMDNSEVPVLPGFFVKADIGTGIVMSVPSHAPFDYVALQRLKKENYPMPEMEYKKVIDVEMSNGIGIGRSLGDVAAGKVKPEHPEIPALAYLEILHANPDSIDDMIEFATKLIYREESHWGIMAIGEFKGMREPEARDKIKEKLTKGKEAFEIYIISNDEPVYCRCGTRVIVNIVDQWFINYGKKEWKEHVKKIFPSIIIYPEKLRLTFDNMVDWLDLRAAERAQGLGTKFPFSEGHIIEALSDSTIYMSFYTFVHVLRNADVKPVQLESEFFDYVFLGEGSIDSVASTTGISSTVLQKCKESFDYWYVNTSRHSAPDLIPNHLIMYVFNHVALMKEKNWPKRIVVNGFVNYEGEKMSKSLGNIVPLVDGIGKYGSDPLRFIEIAGADLDTTTEFSADGINSVHSRNDFLYRCISSLHTMKSKELSHMDYWLYSKLNSKILNATQYMDNVNLKNAYTEIYYNSVNELKRYADRNGDNEIVMREFLECVTLMLGPAMPHIAEEFWSALGKTTLVAQERWPEVNKEMINPDEELVEEIVDSTVSDIKQGIELTARMPENKGKSPKEIRLIIAEPWKLSAYNMLAKSRDITSVIESSEFSGVDKSKLSKFVGQFAKRMNSMVEKREIGRELLLKGFIEAKDFMAAKFDSSIVIEREFESKSERAQRALPDKPSIDIAWG
jgi:leucyl-tRNA synthetase